MADKFNLEGFSVDENDVCTASGGFVGDVTGDITGDVTGQVFGSVTTYIVDGAIDITDTCSLLSSTAASTAMTLEAGTIGQKISIGCKAYTNTMTVTPAQLAGGTTLTFSAIGDSIELTYFGASANGGWYITGNNSVVVS